MFHSELGAGRDSWGCGSIGLHGLIILFLLYAARLKRELKSSPAKSNQEAENPKVNRYVHDYDITGRGYEQWLTF